MTKYQEAVTAMARAIRLARRRDLTSKRDIAALDAAPLNEDDKRAAQAALTAALQVLREPDEGIRRAGDHIAVECLYAHSENGLCLASWEDGGSLAVWQAMLDAVGDKAC